jgi:hypothetical protein
MTIAQRANPFPPTAPDWGVAFVYGTLSCTWVHWLVAPELVTQFLAGTGFMPALFNGQALVNIDFQAYTSTASYGLEMTNEVELNLVVFPEVREAWVPSIPLQQYLVGMEQTKMIGNFRLAVSCDDLVAIYYGRKVFGENKYPGTFNYTIPNVNGQSSDDMSAMTVWDVDAFDSPTPIPLTAPNNPPPPQQGVEICHVKIDVAGLGGRIALPSPFVRYSQWPADPPPTDDPGSKGVTTRRPAGSRWNVLGPHLLYMLDPNAASPVSMTLGPSTGPMAQALNALRLATARPVAITTFQYQPAAVEGRPVFADIP